MTIGSGAFALLVYGLIAALALLYAYLLRTLLQPQGNEE